MSAATATNVRLNELLDYVRSGRILDAMREFYADDVVMTEPAYGATVGLAANIAREEKFVASVKEFKNFEARTAIDEETGQAFYENVMDWIGTDGKPYHVEQVAVQTWKNGKIVRERFYYNAA
jgi:ketosteroid isomerase-like protein